MFIKSMQPKEVCVKTELAAHLSIDETLVIDQGCLSFCQRASGLAYQLTVKLMNVHSTLATSFLL